MKKTFVPLVLSLSILSSLPTRVGHAAEAEGMKGPVKVPVNKWVKVDDCPPDPLGRELQPGRGAYWAYSPDAGKFFRYGGYTPSDCNALWNYDLSLRKWENPFTVDYTWPPPTNRPGAGAWWSMAYDSKRKVFWLHGGTGIASRKNPALFHDIWKYDPATATFTAMKSKKWPRFSARIVYDSKNDLVIRAPAYGREWAARHNKGTTWVYNPNSNTWEGRKTPLTPTAANGGVWVYHAQLGKVIFLGTTKDGKNAPTWTYDAASNTWEKLVTKASPPARVYAGCAYDAAHRLVVVYGGLGQPEKGYGYGHRGGGLVLHDTWTFDLDRKIWTELKVGAPTAAILPGGSRKRFLLRQAMDYDSRNKALLVSSPTFGVWALRLHKKGTPALPELQLPALPVRRKPEVSDTPVYRPAPPNRKLLNLQENIWVRLLGGPAIGGGEVPATVDETTGFVLRYGGCNDGGTTFASGYGNGLSAYDPATERWIALRWTDPCGPPRPANGCTRFYTYDPSSKITWFTGGTSGNALAASLPPGTKGGTWYYDGVRDIWKIMATSGKQPPVGVVACFDRANNRLITVPKAAWSCSHICVLDPAKKKWEAKTDTRARAYTFATYVDSLRGLMVIEPVKGQNKTLFYSYVDDVWKEMKPKGEPAANGRPALAYDPDNDVVLCLLAGQTYIYKVKDNTWERKATNKPGKSGEGLVYDRRHKVFLATTNMGEHMWAYRFKKAGSE